MNTRLENRIVKLEANSGNDSIPLTEDQLDFRIGALNKKFDGEPLSIEEQAYLDSIPERTAGNSTGMTEAEIDSRLNEMREKLQQSESE